MSSLDVRAIDVNQLRKQPCPSTKQEFRVFLSEAAFDRAVERGDKDTAREIGGVLVGEVLRDDAGPYLRIDATIDALHADEKGAELTFTHATWEHIHKEMDGKHQDKRVVGWYHTHPGFGVFLSDRDQFIHKSFFNLPFQVAFVYDPKSREHGMFTWHDNEVWRARRYWIGAREQAWDGPRAPAEPQGRDHDEERKPRKVAREAASREPERAPLDDGNPPVTLGTFVVVGILVLAVGGMLGYWRGSGSANETVVAAQLAVVNAREDAARQERASLQRDIVELLRDTFSDEALHQPLAKAIKTLDEAIAALPADAAAQIKTARDTLVQLEQTRGGMQRDLAGLAAAARNASQPSRELMRELADQRAALGGLYAELAAQAVKAGDRGRALALLSLAAHFDPANRPRYEIQLQTFDPSGHLPPDHGTPADQGAPR